MKLQITILQITVLVSVNNVAITSKYIIVNEYFTVFTRGRLEGASMGVGPIDWY